MGSTGVVPASSVRRRANNPVPARSARSAASNVAARHSSMSPTHSNGFAPGAQPEQRPEPPFVGRILQRLVGGEHGFELDAVHERCEHEIDETTLVTAAAPVVQPLGRVLVKGAVAAAKGVVVPRQARELSGDPQFAARAEGGEHGDARPEGREDEVPERPLEFVALGPLVVHGDPLGHEGGHGGGPLVGEHHGIASLDDGRDQGGGGDDGGDRHVTVEEPGPPGPATDEGVDGALDRARWATPSRPRRPRWRGSAGPAARRRTARRRDAPRRGTRPSRWSRCRRRRESGADRVPARTPPPAPAARPGPPGAGRADRVRCGRRTHPGR